MAESRRSRKRVDYSKFGAGNAEDSDDDFQQSLSPPVAKKTKKTKEKKSNNRKEVTLKEDHGNKRKTRTSNVELIFEEDINTALQLSSIERPLNYESDDDIVEHKRKKAKKTIIEVISDEDEEDHGNNNEDKENIQTTNMLTDPGLTDTDLTSLTAGANHPKEKDDVRQDMSPKADLPTKINCTSVRSISERSKAERDSKLIVASAEGLPQLIEKRFKSDRKDTRPSTPKVVPSCQSIRSPCFQSAPGKLRLGLSRKIRIAKPLHPHVAANVIVAQK